jgi:hypothetical protein
VQLLPFAVRKFLTGNLQSALNGVGNAEIG